MRITLLARADNTGLGSQTWEFYKHMAPSKTYIIDITQINKTIGKDTPQFYDRYPDAKVIEGFPDFQMCKEILSDTDVLFTVETPYNYYLFQMAREMGVKTVLQYNYEFLDYLNQPNLPYPDLLMAPSLWQVEQVVTPAVLNNSRVIYIPVPTNRTLLPFRPRRQANHFLHIAGWKTYADRNGTGTVIKAMEDVASKDVKLTIHSQHDLGIEITDPRIEVKKVDVENYWEIYSDDYDVLLLPRRYGGLSLQLNEAMSVGMPVLMTDCEPQNKFLPKECLIPVEDTFDITTRTVIKAHNPSPKVLANMIDDFHNLPKLTLAMSHKMDEIASKTSWKRLTAKYTEVLENLCKVTEK